MKTTSLTPVTELNSPGVSADKQLVPEGAAHEGAPRLDVLEVDHPARHVGLDPARQGLGCRKYWHFILARKYNSKMRVKFYSRHNREMDILRLTDLRLACVGGGKILNLVLNSLLLLRFLSHETLMEFLVTDHHPFLNILSSLDLRM